jgi:hypothetical protein
MAVLSAGCVGFLRDSYKDVVTTLTPTPTAPVTVTPVPINQTIERQYMFADKLYTGLEYYNDGIRAMTESKNSSERSDWSNATLQAGMAKMYMEQARVSFIGMKPYAITPEELNLTEKWNETAYYEGIACDYMNQSYAEWVFQASRTPQNLIKYNDFVRQANYYIGLAKASKAEAEALEGRTFIGQQGQIK